MLATRIIPTILSKNGQLVKGEGFKADRVVGNALQAARIHAMRGVDELVLLDVTATKEGREPDYEMVRRLSEGLFTPLTVGGGIKNAHHVEKLLRAGADKVCLGSLAFEDWDEIKKLSERFGNQCVTVSIDALPSGKACIKFDDYGFLDHQYRVTQYAKGMEEWGAGEILLQSVMHDGTMEGYDIDLIKAVSKAVSIPVIASGGCSGHEDMYNAIKAGASAVAAGALFQFTDATPRAAAEYLSGKGIEVRV